MRLPLLTAFALTAVACAPVEGGGLANDTDLASGRCFHAGQIHAFNVVDRVAYVRSNQGDVYRLAAPRNCFDAGTTGLTVEPHVRGGQRLCADEEARVRVARASSAPLTCIARIEGPVADSSVSGLPARQR